MEANVLELVKESKLLNSKLVSLPRILILVALEDLGKDGATYRELKAGLEINDGVLFSNLNVLEKMGYIEKSKVEVEDKEMTAYAITEEGKAALNSLRSWFDKLKR